MRSNEDLEGFAFVASHDLREPLRMVTSYLELLEKRISEKLNEKEKLFLYYAKDGAERMSELIHALLQFSRAGRVELNPEKVESEEVFNLALQSLETKIKKTEAEITHDELPTLFLNPALAVQVFQNLIDNGIKYQKKGSKPKVHISAKGSPSEWEFIVSDNGIGIEEAFAKEIFKPFRRLQTRSDYPGTGIGLSLCKKIVERHGGKIWVESIPDQGSQFHFTIPKNIQGQHFQKGNPWIPPYQYASF